MRNVIELSIHGHAVMLMFARKFVRWWISLNSTDKISCRWLKNLRFKSCQYKKTDWYFNLMTIIRYINYHGVDTISYNSIIYIYIYIYKKKEKKVCCQSTISDVINKVIYPNKKHWVIFFYGQSLVTKLVVGYNLIQYIFIGSEFWQIRH